MGTRNLTCVYLDGALRVAQYGQWDGYVEGQGNTVLEFLAHYNRETFLEKLRASSFETDEAIEAFWTAAGANGGFINTDKAKKAGEARPEFSRDTAAGILEIIANSPPGIKLQNRVSFSTDSLFCEYAYVLDFDTETLEVYTGFNKDPLGPTDRFYNQGEPDYEYYPIRLKASYDLSNPPGLEQMVNDVEEREEEVDEAHLALKGAGLT